MIGAVITFVGLVTFDKVMQKVSARKIDQIYAKHSQPDGTIAFGDFKKAWEESSKWVWFS